MDARTFAEAWCDAWNRHDLEEVLSHYADPPAHTSPLVVERLGRADGTIRDSAELRDYFRRGLEATPPLRFELIDAFESIDGVAVLYRNHRGKTVVETMQLDAAGKVARSCVYHR